MISRSLLMDSHTFVAMGKPEGTRELFGERESDRSDFNGRISIGVTAYEFLFGMR